MNSNPTGLKLLITIVDRKKGKKVVKLFEKLGCTYHHTILGYGTAPVEIFDYLGFGKIEKDVVLSVADEEMVPFMYDALNQELDFASPGHGISCSIPIKSVDSTRAIKAILEKGKNGK